MPPDKRSPNKQPLHVTDDKSHPNYFYHVKQQEKGRNDPAPIQEALSRLNINDPTTFGGFSSSSVSGGPKPDSFTVHMPPDVSRETHIIAVLGIEKKWASPRDDGWFLSDFLAFWHLLHGSTVSQTWMHSVDLKDCVDTYERYLHGNPFKERKVVLNAEILQSFSKPDTKHAPRYYAGPSIKKDFQQKVFSECKIAQENKRNVLVLMFGHGDLEGNGICIGNLTQKTLKLSAFVKNLKGFEDTRITVLSTACFSGGWSCAPDLRAFSSTIMAAGPKKASHSWNYSCSFGRADGSMFTSAVVNKLTSLSPGRTLLDAAEEENIPLEKVEAQEESYAKFCSTIYQTLLSDVDRRGLQHEISFSAQGDNWSDFFSHRVGIPIENYQARWNALPVYARDDRMHPGHWTNRDPYVSSEMSQEYFDIRSKATVTAAETPLEATGSAPGKRKISGLYGGEPSAFVRKVIANGNEYLNSYQGNDDTGNDGSLHNLIRRISNGQETDEAQIERAWNAIRYRMNQMTTADRYIKAMQIPWPLGQQCCEFDTENIEKTIGRDKFNSILRTIFDDHPVLFPKPTDEQGLPFYKGHFYIAAAFHYAGLSKEDVQSKLKTLGRKVDAEVEEQKNLMKRDPEVTSKRQRLFAIYDKALGSISPSKRRSRGLSLTGEA